MVRRLVCFPTPVGRVPRADRGPRVLAAAVAVLAVALDLWAVRAMRVGYPWRALLAGAALMLLWLACRRDRVSLGLTVRTIQGAAWWWRATAVTAAVLGAFLLVACGNLYAFGALHPVHLPPSRAGSRVVHACLWAPLVEEALYRVVLVVPLAAVLRSGWVVLVAGLVFAGLHVLYGNLAPDNAVAGVVMTWAFLRSGSVLVPWLWHAGGNLFVLATQVAAHAWW